MRVRKDNLVAKQLDRDKLCCGILPWPCIAALDKSFPLYILFFLIHITEREMILSNFYLNLYGFCAYAVSNGLLLPVPFGREM